LLGLYDCKQCLQTEDVLRVALCVHVMPCTFAEFCCNCSSTDCITANKMVYCSVFGQLTTDHAKHVTDLTCQDICKNCLFIYLYFYLCVYISVLWIVSAQFCR